MIIRNILWLGRIGAQRICFFNIKKGDGMKVLDLNTTREFTEGAMKRIFLVEDSEFFKIINFNLKAGVTFPVHSHDLDGELSNQVIEGEGFFLGDNDAEIPAKTGNILISQIREPHGVRATTDMWIVVTIAPPI
jgi:quercetin dioxygenase-like cupin family protein